jgi:hypothetical protein
MRSVAARQLDDLARLAAAEGRPERAGGVVEVLDAVAALNPGVRSLAAAPLQARGFLESDAQASLAAVDLLRGTDRVLESARAAEDAARRELAAEAARHGGWQFRLEGSSEEDGR